MTVDLETQIKEGAMYVEEYLRLAKGKELPLEMIKEIIDLHYDYLLLIGTEERK